jgi:hypothetical protein
MKKIAQRAIFCYYIFIKIIAIQMEIIQLDIQQQKERKRLQRAAVHIAVYAKNFPWQLGELAKALPQLIRPEVRKGAVGVLKGYFFDYRSAGRAKYEREINVARPIDEKIPFVPKELPVYISFVGLWISGVNFLKKEFGQKASADIAKFITGIADYYFEAGQIFKKAQTSFERTGEGGLKFKLLRAIDSNKNAAPSLHAEVAAHTYSRISDIIDAQASDPSLYEPIKNVYFQQAVKILESLLLVKQHVVLDIGAGLAVLSAHDEFFTDERAYKIVGAMFRENSHGMDKATVSEIHKHILTTYNEVTATIRQHNQSSVADAVIKYLKNLETK